MSNSPQFYEPGPVSRKLLGPFAWRPRLTSGLAVGILCYLALGLFGYGAGWASKAVPAWDLTCLWIVGLTFLQLRHEGAAELKGRAAIQDEGNNLILAVVLAAAIASLVAVAFELSLAKDSHGLFKGIRVGAAVTTVALSWLLVQVIFGLHYAHEYYAPDETTPEDDVIGGLQFPGKQEPDFWDFMHFSIVIGVAGQTADIAFTSRLMRRIGTLHSIVSFLFNTAILALTINLLAGLF